MITWMSEVTCTRPLAAYGARQVVTLCRDENADGVPVRAVARRWTFSIEGEVEEFVSGFPWIAVALHAHSNTRVDSLSRVSLVAHYLYSSFSHGAPTG